MQSCDYHQLTVSIHGEGSEICRLREYPEDCAGMLLRHSAEHSRYFASLVYQGDLWSIIPMLMLSKEQNQEETINLPKCNSGTRL